MFAMSIWYNTHQMVFLIPLLVLLSAFFSSAETVLFSLTGAQRARIRERSAKADRHISRCLSDKAILFSTILVGNTFVNFAIATAGYYIFEEFFPQAGGFAAVPAMTILLLVFGEVLPKQIALRRTESLAPAIAFVLQFWRLALAPFNLMFRFASRAFATALERERRALSDDELVSVLDAAAENGEFSAADAEMIEGVLRLSELHANDEMTPRVDMETYDRDLPESARKDALASAKHLHLPVINRSPDIVEGIVNASTGEIEDALFVPETVTLDDLLVTFRRSGKPIAIVLDEYGGTAGLITLEDIVEEVVGEIEDEFDPDNKYLTQISEREWMVDGRFSTDDAIELGWPVEDTEEYETIAGFVLELADRLPRPGDVFEHEGWQFRVQSMRGRRVSMLRVIAPEPAHDDEEDGHSSTMD